MVGMWWADKTTGNLKLKIENEREYLDHEREVDRLIKFL